MYITLQNDVGANPYVNDRPENLHYGPCDLAHIEINVKDLYFFQNEIVGFGDELGPFVFCKGGT
jgi:hypothetical protein